MAEVVVVGGGVGGLCAAIRLRAAGHDVQLHEQHDELGGKLTVERFAGCTFETGPSLLTYPAIFAETLACAATTLHDELDLVRLDPQFHYRFADGSTLEVPDGRAQAFEAFEAFRPGAGEQWRALLDRGRRIWEVSERTFFAGPMGSPWSLARRMRAPSDLVAIDPFVTLARRAEKVFPGDARLQQWLGRYATYSGSSPWRTPATLACIPYLEHAFGAWYPKGGLGALRDALVRAAGKLGVELCTASDVAAIESDGTRVRGVRLRRGGRLGADVVVANVDALHLYRDLLPHGRQAAAVRRAGRSSSGFVLLLAVEGRTPGLRHHNVAFSADYAAEFRQLFDERRPADEPTVYVCASCVTDPSVAPPDVENWFVLVNAPSEGRFDWERGADAYRERVLATMASRGWDLSGRIRESRTITPADLARRHRSEGGAIYGTSSNGRRSAFLRPGNRGPVRGLYLVGGSSHPGGGLPLVAMSARIVADLVAADRW